MIKAIVVILIVLVSLDVGAYQSKKIKKMLKEEAVSTPVGAFLGKAFSFLDPGYVLAAIESNRVHSVKNGQGFEVNIENFNDKLKMYATPTSGGIGARVQLFDNNYLLPGNYKLITSIGTKSYALKVNKDMTIDYHKLMKSTDTDGQVGLGRLKIELFPSDAKIVIYGTPHKYHSGLQLPVGNYKVRVSKAGYQTQRKTLRIAKNKLTLGTFKLQVKKATSIKVAKVEPDTKKDRAEDVERISVTGSFVKQDSELDSGVTDLPLIDLGELQVGPVLDGVEYIVVDSNNIEKKYHAGMVLPSGAYGVVAKIKKSNTIIKTKQIKIEPLGFSDVVFKIEIVDSPYNVKAIVDLNWRRRIRETVVLQLVDANNKEFTFKRKVTSRKLSLDLDLQNGKYHAYLIAKNKQYDLGSLELSGDRVNKFAFKIN
jgi:hypothetical protein